MQHHGACYLGYTERGSDDSLGDSDHDPSVNNHVITIKQKFRYHKQLTLLHSRAHKNGRLED